MITEVLKKAFSVEYESSKTNGSRAVLRCRWSQLAQWARDKKQTIVKRASSMSSPFFFSRHFISDRTRRFRLTMRCSNKLLFLFALILTSLQQTTGKLSDNETHTPSNESISTLGTTTVPVSSSPLITALSSKSSASTRVHKKLSSSPTSSTAMTPYSLARNLVEQFNRYREAEILTRIKHCDSNMKLNEMCESYSFDNHTYSLIRQSSVDFQSFQHVYDALVDRLIVQKLSQFCSPGDWCLGNLTNNDIRFTVDVLRQRGRSFCSLEKCHHRLAVHINACPSILARVNHRQCSGRASLFLLESQHSHVETLADVLRALPGATALELHGMCSSARLPSSSSLCLLASIRGK